jgi:hypothetical protein
MSARPCGFAYAPDAEPLVIGVAMVGLHREVFVRGHHRGCALKACCTGERRLDVAARAVEPVIS